MKSILSMALLSSLGLWATAAGAWETPPPNSPPSCGSSTFPATGQLTPAVGTMTHTGATVRDDGFVKAGGPLSYRDNGDGTISDLNTGLMWEKKSNDGSVHDVNKTFVWSSLVTDTVWDWIDEGRPHKRLVHVMDASVIALLLTHVPRVQIADGAVPVVPVTQRPSCLHEAVVAHRRAGVRHRAHGRSTLPGRGERAAPTARRRGRRRCLPRSRGSSPQP